VKAGVLLEVLVDAGEFVEVVGAGVILEVMCAAPPPVMKAAVVLEVLVVAEVVVVSATVEVVVGAGEVVEAVGAAVILDEEGAGPLPKAASSSCLRFMIIPSITRFHYSPISIHPHAPSAKRPRSLELIFVTVDGRPLQ